MTARGSRKKPGKKPGRKAGKKPRRKVARKPSPQRSGSRTPGGKDKSSARRKPASRAGIRGAHSTSTPLASPFPGRAVKVGERDVELVRTLQRRLNELGCGPITEDGTFGPQTASAVRLFQARFSDLDGAPLQIDALVGSLTWAALFGRESVPSSSATGNALLGAVLRVAASQVGVREDPPGSNRGPEVDGYLRSVGLDPTKASYPWCAAFVYACFEKAAKATSRKNPVARTAGALDLWEKAPAAARITAGKAHLDESQVKPGQVFVIDVGTPGGDGHTGIVERVEAGKLTTIEGNSNEGGSREGIGVFRRRGRRIRDVNVGFLDYGSR